ncbi:MAG: CPBP family intramembrane glutamate endopeptidase, partial [Planctomycetota bacterium]
MASGKRNALLALLLLVPAPSFGTWMAMHVSEGPVGQAVFLATKVWILALPVAWLVLVDKGRPTFPRPVSRGMGAACLTGAAIFLAIGAAYWLL